MSDRTGRALGEPPENLADFPTAAVAGEWFRAHTAGNGPWWFASEGQGRFDLTRPDGTCYLASHPTAAVHERLGETLVRAGMISGFEADRMVVSRLPLNERAADEPRPAAPALVAGRAAARAAGIAVVDPPRAVSIANPPA